MRSGWPAVVFLLVIAWALLVRAVLNVSDVAQWVLAILGTALTWFFAISPMRMARRRVLLVEMREAGLPPAETGDQWQANIERLREIKREKRLHDNGG